MGHNIIITYLGAYIKIDVPNERFCEELERINFYNDYDEEDEDSAVSPVCNHTFFERPYEGIEEGIEEGTEEGFGEYSALLPLSDDNLDYCKDVIINMEFEFELKDLNFELYKKNVEERYAEAIEYLKMLFGKDKVRVATGIVNYRDEIG